MARRRTAVLAIALAVGLVLGACGNDDPAVESDGSSRPAGEGAGVTVRLSMDSLELPAEVEGGVVEVTLETELEGGEVAFSKVAAGTDEATFRAGIIGALTGKGFPDWLEATTGLNGEAGDTATVTLPEGDYFAWSLPEPPEGEEGQGGEPAEGEAPPAEEPGAEEEGEGDGGPPPEALVIQQVKVTTGQAADLPDPGDRIVMKDFTFEADVTGGADKILFRNEGPNEYHHVVIFDFKDMDPEFLKKNAKAFVMSDGPEELPEEFAKYDNETLDAGSSGVFSPGLGAVETQEIKEGNTYLLACFIADKAGGPPHAFSHDMFSVFTA